MVPLASPRISRVLSYLGVHQANSSFAYTTLTFYGPTFQRIQLPSFDPLWRILQPHASHTLRYGVMHSLGCSRFARHYLGNHKLLPYGSNIFVFSSCAYLDISVQRVPSFQPMNSARGIPMQSGQVALFGDLRIKAY